MGDQSGLAYLSWSIGNVQENVFVIIAVLIITFGSGAGERWKTVGLRTFDDGFRTKSCSKPHSLRSSVARLADHQQAPYNSSQQV